MNDINPNTLYGAWYYIYGKGSHMNLAGKILLGIPMFPLVFLMVMIIFILDSLFTKTNNL